VADWSLGTVPTSTDVACIGSGKTVKVTEGINQAGVVQGEGTLVISGGSLEVASALESSSIKGLSLGPVGTLKGPAQVEVTGSFSTTGGQMEGTGTTVIKSGATGLVNSGSDLTIAKRTLNNEGSLTVTYPEGGIVGKEGATIANHGTLTINGQGEIRGLLAESSGTAPLLVNTGTVQKTEGSGLSRIGWVVDNENAITASSGQLDVLGGGTSGKENPGSWTAGTGAAILFGKGTFSLGATVPLSGAITVLGATVSAGKVEGGSSTLTIETEGCCEPGKLELTGPSVSTVSNLSLAHSTLATLKGSGEVDVTGSLSVTAGRMEGATNTVIKPGAVATISIQGLALIKRTIVNEGTLTSQYPEGSISGAEGGGIVNRSTFTINGQGEGVLYAEGSTSPKPKLINSGTVQKTEGTGTAFLGWEVDNESAITAKTGQLKLNGGGTSGNEAVGSWSASPGAAILFGQGTYSLGAHVPVSGTVKVVAANVTAGVIEGSTASLSIEVEGCCAPGRVELAGPGTSVVKDLTFRGSSLTKLTGAAELDVTGSFLDAIGGTMEGTGRTVLGSAVTSNVEGSLSIVKRTVVNEGTIVEHPGAYISGSSEAILENTGTMTINAQGEIAVSGENVGTPVLVNTGIFQKTEGTGKAWVSWYFENYGRIDPGPGEFEFTRPRTTEPSTQYGGAENPSAPGQPHASCGDPVSCATGNFSEAQTDLSVGGRGVGLDLMRTYNSQAAAEGVKGMFGYGWTSSFSDHLVVNKTSKITTLFQANGSTVPFTEGTGGAFTAPAWTQDTLSGTEGTGYTMTLANQTKYKFVGSSGRLESVTDRDGNATTLV
jgi:hypothetical protein